MTHGRKFAALGAALLLLLSAASVRASPPPIPSGQATACWFGLYLPLVVGGTGSTPEPDAAAAERALVDFDGDGCGDLVIGIPNLTVNQQTQAGAFQVLYGTRDGLSAEGNQLWHQESPSVLGAAEVDDRLGLVVEAGDFDGDGFTDVAAAAPYEVVGTVQAAGVVNVLYGSLTGLGAARNQLWHQDAGGVSGTAQTFDLLGFALAVGDFDSDGYDDLAMGVPNEPVSAEGAAGAVNVLYGSAAGLTADGNQLWYPGIAGMVGMPVPDAFFGTELATGDFDGDGYADLAIGADEEDVNGAIEAGAVYVLYGSESGLSGVGSQRWDQASPGVFGSVEEFDLFGTALAAGNFDGDAFDDLAIGASSETYVGVEDAGVAHVLYGTSAGLTGAGSYFIAEADPLIDGEGEEDNHLGEELAAGDFDGDGYADLALGIFGQDVSSFEKAGAVLVLYGSAGGLSPDRHQRWDQSTGGINSEPAADEFFGIALSASDYNGDGRADLAIGVRGEMVGPHPGAGAVHVLYGTAGGLSAAGSQFWTGDSPGLDGEAANNANFGYAVR